MEGAYLPGNIRQRMQELMKEHKITQAQLATRIGSTESAISRFVSGKTDKISTEHLLRIAKVFEVSTDFLLGEVNTPDRTNFDIEELGLSVQAARNLYTGKANAEIVNRLLESPRFAEVTYMMSNILTIRWPPVSPDRTRCLLLSAPCCAETIKQTLRCRRPELSTGRKFPYIRQT